MQRLSLSDTTIEDWNYNSNQNAFSILTIKSSEDVILQEIMAMVLLFLLSILGWLQSFFWGEDDIGPGQSIAACEVPDKDFPLAPGKEGHAIRALIVSGGQFQGLKCYRDISWGYCFPNKIICLFVSGMSSSCLVEAQTMPAGRINQIAARAFVRLADWEAKPKAAADPETGIVQFRTKTWNWNGIEPCWCLFRIHRK